LSSFAISVTLVARSFASGLVLDHTRNAGSVSLFACIGLDACCRRDGSLLFGGFGLNALCLFSLYPLKRDAPLFASCSNRLAFRLSDEPGRLRRFLCGTKRFKKGGFGVGGGAPTLGKVIVSGVFQVWLPVMFGIEPNDKPIERISR
jgi:hypothetical protein